MAAGSLTTAICPSARLVTTTGSSKCACVQASSGFFHSALRSAISPSGSAQGDGRGRTEEFSSGHPSVAQHATLLARQLIAKAPRPPTKNRRAVSAALRFRSTDERHARGLATEPQRGSMRNCLRFSDRPVVEPLAFAEIDRRPGAVYQSRSRALEPSVTDCYRELVRKTPDWKPNA